MPGFRRIRAATRGTRPLPLDPLPSSLFAGSRHGVRTRGGRASSPRTARPNVRKTLDATDAPELLAEAAEGAVYMNGVRLQKGMKQLPA